MEDEKIPTGCARDSKRAVVVRQSTNPVYCLGLIGALIYFIQHAPSFGAGVIGVLKALVWPVFVVHRLLGFLKM